MRFNHEDKKKVATCFTLFFNQLRSFVPFVQLAQVIIGKIECNKNILHQYFM